MKLDRQRGDFKQTYYRQINPSIQVNIIKKIM